MEELNYYAIDTLMAQTRKLAADYYKTTQQTLTVSHELAKYDACRLLALQPPTEPVSGVDAIKDDLNYQIKSRVILNDKKRNYRIGQLNIGARWDVTLVLILNEIYEPVVIYQANKDTIIDALSNSNSTQKNPRGQISLAKFKAISQAVWTASCDEA